MRVFRMALVVAAVALIPVAAQAALIVAPHSGGWEFTFTNPTGSTSWNTTTNSGVGDWAVGTAPFGNNRGGYIPGDPTGQFDWVTYWASDGSDGDDLWIRRAVDFGGFDLASIQWDLGIDNGFKLYANGALVASGIAEGYTTRWEYSGNFGTALQPGVNVIAVALEDHGGLTAWDMQITGTPVPEPATLSLLGLGLVGIARAARRKNHR